ncbi:MAG: MerR family transcriptional regulator [Kiritimatiellae bacterium]|nr:MerR family transcriptional regulator [Kiritimatiellia bacterium]
MKPTKLLSIAEASARSGLPPDTLRYYDRLGLLPHLRRTSGRRRFSEDDLAALSLVVCLRDTGMPLASIRDFMRASGPGTPDARLAILRKHRAEVSARLDEYRRAERRVDFKIWYYEEAKRLGGIARLPPLSALLKQYRKETGKSTNW